jgi:hypothetical protein
MFIQLINEYAYESINCFSFVEMKSFILLMSTALILLSISCKTNTTTEEPKMKTYQSDSLKLTIQYPTTWEQKTNPNTPNMVGFFEPLSDSADQYQENLQLWVDEIPFELPDSIYKKAAITQIQLANPTFNIKRLPEIKTSQATFSHFQFEFTTNDSTQYMVNGYVFLKKKYGYNINFTSEKNKWEKYETIIEQLLQTFKPL